MVYHIVLRPFDPEAIIEAGAPAFKLLRAIDTMMKTPDGKPRTAERLAVLVGDPHVRDSEAYKRLREYRIIYEISSTERKNT